MDQLQPPRELLATTKMGRNEPCWCGSGAKWKKCHKDRVAGKRPNLNAVIGQVSAQFKKKISCFHPEAGSTCSGPIINSHTVQKSGPLKAISRDGHVYGIKESGNSIVADHGLLSPKLVGISKASVFPGFCRTHDNNLFSSIEGSKIPFNRSNAHLFAYRAICNELFYKTQSSITNNFIRSLDSGGSISSQRLIQQMASNFDFGNNAAVEELTLARSDLNSMFKSHDFSEIDAVSVQFDTLLPYAFTCAVVPFYDFKLKKIQDNMTRVLDYVTVSTYVENGNTSVAFVWKKSTKIDAFIDSLKQRKPEDVASLILRFALEKTENIFLNPEWYEGLSKSDLEFIKRLMMIGVEPVSSMSGVYNTDNGRIAIESACKFIDVD